MRARPGGGVQVFRLPSGPTRSVLLRIDSVTGPHPLGTVVGIVDVSVPPTHPEWTLTVPADSPVAGPTTYDFALAPGSRRSCVPTPDLVVCQPLLNVPGGASPRPVVPRPEPADRVGGGLGDPATGHRARRTAGRLRLRTVGHCVVVAGDRPRGHCCGRGRRNPRTAWIAGGDDASYTVSWTRPHTVSSLRFLDPAGLAASPPEVVDIATSKGTQSALVDASARQPSSLCAPSTCRSPSRGRSSATPPHLARHRFRCRSGLPSCR